MILLAALPGFQPISQPRIQTELANGVRVYAETMASEGQASVQMTVSLAEISEDPALYGLPHMIEHLAGLGRDRKLDERLERQGMLLTLSTTRDALFARIDCRPEQYAYALACLYEIASPLEIDEDELARERAILLQEIALDNPLLAFDRTAWQTVEGGQDPMGNAKAFEDATVSQLEELHARMFRGRRLAVTLAGPLPANVMADRAGATFAALAEGDERTVPERLTVLPDKPLTAPQAGGARALAVEGLDSPESLAAFAAGMAFAQKQPGLTVIYPPSLWRGFITLVHRDPAELEAIDRLTGEEANWYAFQGREQLRRWVNEMMKSPSQLAAMQGLFSVQSPTYDVHRLREDLNRLTWQSVRNAMARFRPGRVLEVRGS
jgi:hypothetical protein